METGSGPIAATVFLSHNTFHDSSTTLLPETRIKVGEAVKWTWNSAHCHSVWSAGNFYSRFHYPTTAPSSPQVVPGFFEYPVLEMEEPALEYVHTFTEPGTYSYFCEHHAIIGMVATVVVEE